MALTHCKSHVTHGEDLVTHGEDLVTVSSLQEDKEGNSSQGGLAFTTNQLSRCQPNPMRKTLIHSGERSLCCLLYLLLGLLSNTTAQEVGVLMHELCKAQIIAAL